MGDLLSSTKLRASVKPEKPPPSEPIFAVLGEHFSQVECQNRAAVLKKATLSLLAPETCQLRPSTARKL